MIQGDRDLVTDEQAREVLLEILTWHPVENTQPKSPLAASPGSASYHITALLQSAEVPNVAIGLPRDQSLYLAHSVSYAPASRLSSPTLDRALENTSLGIMSPGKTTYSTQ